MYVHPPGGVPDLVVTNSMCFVTGHEFKLPSLHIIHIEYYYINTYTFVYYVDSNGDVMVTNR